MTDNRWLRIRNCVLLFLGVIIVGPLLVSTGVGADDREARAIMERVDARDDGDNQTADMQMILIDRNGGGRIRKISTFTKDKGPDTMRLMFFLHPADVKDTAFFTIDYDDSAHDDDQ